MSLNNACRWRQHLTLDLPAASSRPVWLHACSVGETGSLAPLINALLEKSLPLHLTVVTKTGFAHARRLFGGRIGLSYLPWDVPGLMGRFVRRLRPHLLLLAETEFWPGMLLACRRGGIPVVGINTRISDRSFPRYRASRFLWRRWLSPVSLFLAQSDLDTARLTAMGVDPSRIRVVGNLKFAVPPPQVEAEALRKRLDKSMVRPILLVASTHEGEETILLDMWPEWKRLQPDLLMVIVPRHPRRFDDVADMVRQQGLRLARWSETQADPRADIMLIDTMGILGTLYVTADIAIIGGSLAPVGGHNPLEAAVCGRGVIAGPYVHNFRAIFREMQHAGGAIVAEDCHALNLAVQHFLQHPDELRRMHAHSAAFMLDKARVLERTLKAIHPYLHV